jgi:penicillin-binding protein A
MWSNPSFDPGPLGAHNPRRVRQYWESLDPGSPGSPLVNRATSRGYPPGSSFKTIVAAAALESGRFTPDSTFPDPAALELPLTTATIRNFGRGTCAGGGQIDLTDAFRVSCNTTFGDIGLRIPQPLFRTAERFGFNQRIPFDIVDEPSAFPEIPDDRAPARAQAAIGQVDVVATPLQMALAAATVANGGQVPRPRLVREIIDASGEIVRRYAPEGLGRAISQQTASQLTRMMVEVVERGTGTAAQMEGIQVGGKTGTAETGVEGAAPHAWFIGFAPATNPQLAVAVIVENGGSLGSEATGGAVAAPIAQAVLAEDRRIRQW